MQITEKLRHNILLSLPELSGKEAERISKKTKVSLSTVWRQWRKLKNNQEVFDNPVIVAIAELAAKKKEDIAKRHKKLGQLQEQLSAA